MNLPSKSLLAALIAGGVITVCLFFAIGFRQGAENLSGQAGPDTIVRTITASTTAYSSISTSAATRLLATSTTRKRLGFIIANGCGSSAIWVRTEQDKAAAIGTGIIVAAGGNLSNESFAPVVYQGSVTGIASSTACSSVSVTEYLEDNY